jgi:hypothetical protein
MWSTRSIRHYCRLKDIHLNIRSPVIPSIRLFLSLPIKFKCANEKDRRFGVALLYVLSLKPDTF